MEKSFSVLLGLIAISFCCCLEVSAAVSIYVVRPISDSKILPDTLLPASLLSKTVYLTACRGEYEPGSFVIKSSADVSGLSVQATDLQLPGGAATISSSNIDIRVVKCWYQAGYSVTDLTHKHLTPELLLKDDSLVDIRDTENYLKLSPEGGDPYYACISAPDTLSGEVIHSFQDFPVADSASLQPVNLLVGKNKQFWVTVKVPDSATVGIYSGNINLTAAGISESIRLIVNVPAITLAAPCLKYGIYYSGRLKTNGSISSEDKNEAQFRAEMQNIIAHGVTNPTVYSQQNDTQLGGVLTIRNEEGIDNDNLYFLGLNPSGDVDALKAAVTSRINFVSQYGVGQLYIYGLDEQSLNDKRPQIAGTHDVGGKVFAAQSVTYATAIADVLDLAIVAGPLQSSLADTYHSYGHKIFSYSNPQIGEQNPATYRRSCGIQIWQNSYDGVMNYAYQTSLGSVWNDFDHYKYRDHNFTYPTMNGVIDTMAWEGFREGVDDVRYLTTLLQKIDEVMQGSNNNLKVIAACAQGWLKNVNVNGDLNSIRSKILEYILRLNGLSDGVLAGQWKFNDGSGSSTASDSSGNNNTGTLANMNTSAAWVDGRSGGGIVLNRANNEYIDCGSNASLNILNAITVAAWVYSPDATSQLVYCRSTNGSRFRLNVNNSSAINLYVNTSGQGWHSGGTGGTHNWTGWHHVAWTYDSAKSTTKFYFDGAEDYSSTTVTTGALADGPLQYLRIGGGENNTYFTGGIDEFKVYSKALSEDEIKDLYNSSNLRGAWSFNESSGMDSSGNGNHGTLVNINSDTAPCAGKNGDGITLNRANNEYIDCGNDESLNILNAITATAWVYNADTTSQLFYSRGVNTSNRFRLNVNNSSATNLYVNTSQGWHSGGVGGTHDWNGWHHVAWTYDSASSTTKFYFDGAEDYSSTTVSSGPITANGALDFFRIGGGENNVYFTGGIDEARIYDRALGIDEITAEIKRSSLCGMWSFNNIGGLAATQDSSGNGNDGVLVNINSYTAPCAGKKGDGITLTCANNEYIDCGNGASLNILNAITVAAWVYNPDTTSQLIYCRGINGSRFRLNVNKDSAINLYVNTTGQGWHSGGTGGTHNWTGWHHVAWTYDSSTNTTKFYFDGVQDYSSTTVSTGAINANGALQFFRIGGDENNTYFNGALDEVRVYNRALSGAEVAEIYNN